MAERNMTPQQRLMQFYPYDAWMKWAYKAPIFLWRMGLGPWMGQIFILLTHTGRKSGLPRRTLVEYHPHGGQKYAVAAFGDQAQWLQNIKADPRVTLQSVDGIKSATARWVTDEAELLDVYHLFMRRNPLMFRPYLEALGINPDDRSAFLLRRADVNLLTFDPIEEATPPPLKADMTWLWPVIGVSMLLGWMMGRVGRKR